MLLGSEREYMAEWSFLFDHEGSWARVRRETIWEGLMFPLGSVLCAQGYKVI